MTTILNQLRYQPVLDALCFSRAWLLAVEIILLYRLSVIIYNAVFHPLAAFPGPKLRAVSDLPHCLSLWSGYDHKNVKSLHDQYGSVVRVGPNSLSFNSAQAFQDIYGFQHGRKQIPKDVYWYLPENIHAQRSLINADDADHARMRKLLAHAFSAQALREQEAILTTYFDLLIKRLKDQIEGPSKGKVDLTQWFNFFTFDLVGDLALGKPFGMLEASRPTEFMTRVLRGSKHLIVLWTGQIIPLFGVILRLYARLPGSTDPRRRMTRFAQDCVQQRLSVNHDRKDFISYILRYNDYRGMTNFEIGMTAKTLLNAGTETTATALAGSFWLLLTHPKVLERATAEVRTRFSKLDELNLQTTSPASLPYLFAVIEETLRVYPPAGALAFARRTTGPTTVDGHVVPANTRLSAHQYSAFRSATNWNNPDAFIPERWLGDERFASDERSAFHPFSTGPRVCIGKNLAYAELTSIISRMLFLFDMTLSDESLQWGCNQMTFNFWEKPPLMVTLTMAGLL